uniref:Uncharacterized protein n=1 Tax=Neogobius melanostomus TaxID=47308 RepID=A0A8C6TZ06_9GOBI
MCFEPDTKKKTPVPCPVPLTELMEELPVVQGRSQPIRVLSRLTIVMSDSSHYSACMTYDVDIICISVSERLPFFYKRAPVYGALERGVVFEVSYAASIRDATRRRYTLSNAMFHSDVCKGKSVIVSSAAVKALELRGPHDVMNLTQLFGLSDRDGRDAVTTNCRAALLHGESRKTAGGIIRTFRRAEEQKEEQSPVAKRSRHDAAETKPV